ncbi:MAG: efflux RND transporter periplasmic adaptor subunit [Chitinophagaceae bacterium]|nr:efflux RND transporter periplasmic adaptor subunit [Chitinophagaceae bacterium]
MNRIFKALLPVIAMGLLASCGSVGEKKVGSLEAKKAELEKLKTERLILDEKIEKLQEEIALLDTGFSGQKPRLVVLSTIEKAEFKHFVTLQGKVDQQNVSYITPAGQPGQIKAIYVKQGDRVRKGQLILKLDDEVLRQNVNAIKQQMSTVKAQLELAKSVYDRQKNLWENNIGTEVQLLQAKTNVETLEGQLNTIEANARAVQAQANQSNVYSDVNGIVDDVTARVGETFTGNHLSGGYVRIVNNSDMKVVVTVPENYAGTIGKGSKVVVELPDEGKSFESVISFMSLSVGATTRGFTAEIKAPVGMDMRPNQTAVVKIMDYAAPDAIAVPLNTIQNDENGKYVLIAVSRNGGLVAEKKAVTIGRFSEDSVEILSGLEPGESLVTEGFQDLLNGQLLTTSDK